jgi:predicted aldo/keto reductase-like oxidoreductase
MDLIELRCNSGKTYLATPKDINIPTIICLPDRCFVFRRISEGRIIYTEADVAYMYRDELHERKEE